MKIQARVGDQVLDVEVERENGFYRLRIDGEERIVDAHKLEGDFYSIVSGDRSYEVSVEKIGDGYRVRRGAALRVVELMDAGRKARATLGNTDGPQQITSMMPGKVVRVLVAEGDEVIEGQGLLVVEAMKMENEIASPRAGRVSKLPVAAGQTVEAGELLAVVE